MRDRPLVYAAHPVTSYGTDVERRALDVIASWVPGARVIDPAIRYRDTAEWLDDWPILAPTLAALVVFGDGDATVGTGCLSELADAWRHGIPVAMLDAAGLFRRLSGLRILPDAVRDRFRTARLVPGGRVDPGRLLAVSRSPGGRR